MYFFLRYIINFPISTNTDNDFHAYIEIYDADVYRNEGESDDIYYCIYGIHSDCLYQDYNISGIKQYEVLYFLKKTFVFCCLC